MGPTSDGTTDHMGPTSDCTTDPMDLQVTVPLFIWDLQGQPLNLICYPKEVFSHEADLMSQTFQILFRIPLEIIASSRLNRLLRVADLIQTRAKLAVCSALCTYSMGPVPTRVHIVGHMGPVPTRMHIMGHMGPTCTCNVPFDVPVMCHLQCVMVILYLEVF